MRCPTVHELPPAPADRSGWPWTEQTSSLPPTTPDGKNWPKITIVTPSYNQGPFIEQTIRSVLLQGYPQIEYIIIDGGSTDGTVETIKKYERWLKFWVSEPDRGQSHAINKGLQRATGQLFNWINSDDFLARGALGHVARTAVQNPECVIAGAVVNLYETGETRRHDNGHITLIDMLHLCPAGCYHQPGVFLPLSVLRRVGPVDESLHYAMDWDLTIRVLAEAAVVSIPHDLAFFRMHPSSKTNRRAGLFLGEICDAVYRHRQLVPTPRRAGWAETFAKFSARAGGRCFVAGRPITALRHLTRAFKLDAWGSLWTFARLTRGYLCRACVGTSGGR